MNSLRAISRKIDAMLLMIIAALILTLALSWNYYQSRRMTKMEKDGFAAALLSYSLPAEAAQIIEESVRRMPMSAKSMKLRRSLAEIYMNELNDYQKALAELVFIKTYAADKEMKAEVEESIRYCLNRLGRVYDAERSKLLASGINPIESNIASETLVMLGNRHAIGVEELKLRLQANGIVGEKMTQENVEAMLNSLVQEKLLARAADRENIKKTDEFISRIKEFEKNLAISFYLQNNVLKDGQKSKEQQQNLLSEEISRLAQQEDMKIDKDALSRAFFQKSQPDKPQN